ncbi:MAG: class II aldolase/adducin family protein [Desulfobacterales bacterium]
MADPIGQLKKELLACARRAYAIGLQTGNGGNLSARLAGTAQVVIKGSGTSFGECTMDNLVTVNLDGEMLEGPGKPSREIRTHLAVYRLRPDVHGIFHSHSPWSIAYAEDADEIQPLALHARAKLGVIPILRVDGHADEAVEKAVEALLKAHTGLKAFVQARHGIFALAPTITLAEHHAELVEETAQIGWLVALKKSLPANALKGKGE